MRRLIPRSAVALAGVAGLLLAAESSAARTIHVSPVGAARAAGTAAEPFRTLRAALEVARPGDVVELAAGGYAGATLARSGSRGRPITLAAAPGARVLVRPPRRGASAITVAPGAGWVVIRGVTATGVRASGGGAAGILVGDRAHDILLDRVRVIDNRIYGVEARDVRRLTVRRATISRNVIGIRFLRGGAGSVVTGSVISRNDRMAVDDPTPGNDWGAVGVTFEHTTGPITARGNVLVGNRAPSHDYRYDGSAFESYGGSGIRMIGNRIADNPTAYETGTDGPPCDDVVFARNRVWGEGRASAYARGVATRGLILRCGRRVLIANNTFHRLDDWVFWFDGSSRQAGRLGVRIVGNAYLQETRHAIYAIDVRGARRAAIRVDRDAIGWEGAPGWPGKLAGHGPLRTFAELRRYAGFDVHGRQGALRFADPARHDYRPLAGSIAIDLAPVIAGISGRFHGRAPDAGALEG